MSIGDQSMMTINYIDAMLIMSRTEYDKFPMSVERLLTEKLLILSQTLLIIISNDEPEYCQITMLRLAFLTSTMLEFVNLSQCPHVMLLCSLWSSSLTACITASTLTCSDSLKTRIDVYIEAAAVVINDICVSSECLIGDASACLTTVTTQVDFIYNYELALIAELDHWKTYPTVYDPLEKKLKHRQRCLGR